MIRSKVLPFVLSLLLAYSVAAQAQTTAAPATLTASALPVTYPTQDYPSYPLSTSDQRPTREPEANLDVIKVVHQADELCERIGLPQGQLRERVTQYVQTLLPARTGQPQLVTLAHLLKAHTHGFQVLLAPALPQANYDRYVALLDRLAIRATE